MCNSGHEEEWSSSQNIGTGREATPYINVLIIVYAFLTGLHFDQLKVYIFLLDLKIYDVIYQAFCDRCKIVFVSSTTFYRLKKKLLYPVIWSYWLIHQAQNLAEIKVTNISAKVLNKFHTWKISENWD